MIPTALRRNMASGTNKFLNSSGKNNNNMLIGAAALAALTGLVYWVGYNDVDKRHRNDNRPAQKKD